MPASGAVLAHAEATSEVSLFASATGDVILSYVDARGQVRQSRFDAAAGSDDATVEQWITDGLRRALVRGDGVVLPRGATDGLWTLEAWMQFPLREGQRLLASDAGNGDEWEGVGVRDGWLGVWTREKRDDSDDLSTIGKEDDLPKPPLHWVPLDVTLGEVPVGWHHVAVVAGGDLPARTLRFYIDGLPHGSPLGVATTKTAGDRMVVAPTLPTAELKRIDVGEGIAQIRLWDVALDLEEVQTNSRVVLTGKEPGLVAFHPLDGDLADPVRDTALEVGKPAFGPCTAPIGNPGQRVAVFDGTRRHDFTAFFQSGSRTVETWLRFKPDVVHAQVIFATSVHVSEGWGRFVLYLTDARDDGQQELAAVVLVEGQERRSRVELVADGVWHHVAAMIDYAGGVRLLVDGEEGSAGDELKPTSFALPLDVQDGGIGIIGGGNRGKELRTGFQGELAEMRAWDGERRRIELNRFRHQRAPQGFLRRWAFDEPGTPDAPARLVNDLPIGDTDVRVAEYPTYGLDRIGRRLAIMRRCTAVSAGDGIDLWAQQRVEALDLVWIGNAQFQPTLLGYIEGAPPVPSENLTVDPENYNEATSVTVSLAEELELSWNRSEETTHGFGMDFFIGYENEWEVGANAPLLGRLLSWEAGGLRAGLAASFALDKTEAYETNIAATSAVTRSDTLSLRGFAEDEPAFPDLGPRFVPKNVGYALVVAGLADVFVSRLATSGRMVGYQIVPVSDVPPDVSTITFLINPAYTMNGSLDGQTGMQATSERFFAHVPEARRQFGSRYPASYFRLAEAYALRERIRDDDKRREAFFENFIIDASASEDTIAAQIDDPDFTPREIAVEREEERPAPAAKTAKGAEGEKIGLGDLGDEASGKADEAAEQVEDIKEKIEAESDKKKALVEAKKKEIERLSRPEQREHATSSFRVWQRKMEDLKVRAGKRNIVNSYVWDADGGLRVESEEFASTVEHTVGSALNMEWALGADIALNVSGFQLELSPMYQGSLSQTMSKTRTASSALSLEVDLSGVECQGITDFKDRPIMPGVKVDRYRFMTFYLDGSERNFDEFFNYVVDPEWLASNDEEARALRQTMAGTKGKPWRVMHRVTQVERPALSGFGEDTRPLPKVEQPSEVEQRLSAIESLLKQLAADHHLRQQG